MDDHNSNNALEELKINLNLVVEDGYRLLIGVCRLVLNQRMISLVLF